MGNMSRWTPVAAGFLLTNAIDCPEKDPALTCLTND